MTSLLKQPEVLVRLNISRQTLWKLRKSGHLKPVKLGPNCLRWREADIAKVEAEGLPTKVTKPQVVLAQRTDKQLAVAKSRSVGKDQPRVRA